MHRILGGSAAVLGLAVALAARPVRVKAVATELTGASPADPQFARLLASVAERAGRQLHPLANVPGDDDYRRKMVPVYVRRTLAAALAGEGPVHAV